MIVCSLIGRFVGSYLAEDFSDKKEINKIDEYVEGQNYIPGVKNTKKYESSHFGFGFYNDGNWEMYTDQELEAETKELDSIFRESFRSELGKQNISQELIDKWEESFYAKAEMGAAYIEDGIYVGEINIAVIGAYGLEQIPMDETVEGIKIGIMSAADNVTQSEEIIAGMTYDVIEFTDDIDGFSIKKRMFINEKDGMICMILCTVLEDYEHVMDSFDDCMQPYKS